MMTNCLLILHYQKNKFTEKEPLPKKVKVEGLINCDADKNWLESVHFSKADSHVGFYELFIL
jgi:hypothetical protein